MSLGPTELLAPQAVAPTVLLAVRLSAVIAVAPIYSAATVPVRLRVAVLLLLLILLHPLARAHLARGAVLGPASIGAEALVGMAIGFAAAIFVGAAEMAGDLSAVQMGLSGAAVLDPMTHITVPVLGQFMQLFVVTLMLAADAHLVIIDAVAASLQRLPLGGTVDATAGIGAMLSLGTTVFTLGVRMAAPVMAAVLVGNVALAVLSRAAPQLNVLTVAFPLQIGLGLFTLCAALPVIAMQFVSWSRAYDGVLTQLVSALATGGR